MFPRNLTTEFNCDAMRVLLTACAAAYCKPHEAEQRARAAGATEFAWLAGSTTDTQGFIAANASDVVIAFRGTESVKDWVTDCKFVRRESLSFPGTIHDGFADAFDSVKHDVRFNAQMLSEHRRIWITGHSLGGALAALCAFDLMNAGICISGCYTFGQPRVGDAEFATAYDTNGFLNTEWVAGKAAEGCRTPKLHEVTFRIVNRDDIVPRVPGALIGYRHCGREIFCDAFGKVSVDVPWWKKLPSDVWGIVCELSHGSRLKAVETLVKDHFMAAYIERINS